MKVEIQINKELNETKIVVFTKEITSEVTALVEKLSNTSDTIKVEKNEQTYILKQEDIESIYTEDGKIYVKTSNDKYVSKKRLYEMEEILNKEKFARISNCEIINFDKVEKLDLKILGTISIHLYSGYNTYVSRRYIKRIKEFLNI